MRLRPSALVDDWVQLRDIFTIHPGTACHSHDLLDCPCDRIRALEDDTPSTVDTALEDDKRVTVDAASGFIVASQVKAVDSPKLDKAVGIFFGLKSRVLTHY